MFSQANPDRYVCMYITAFTSISRTAFEIEALYRLSTSSSQDQDLVGHLPIELSFLLCKFLSREGCSLEFSPTGARFLKDGFLVPGRYTALSNNKKMVTILHRELERKVEKVKHMKLEVIGPKTKNNMNFQLE